MSTSHLSEDTGHPMEHFIGVELKRVRLSTWAMLCALSLHFSGLLQWNVQKPSGWQDIASCTASNTGMVAASLAILACSGTFLEVAKRGIWSPERAAQERPDLMFYVLAIDFWTAAEICAAMQTVAAMLAEGE